MYGFNLKELSFLEGQQVSYIIIHLARVSLIFESGSVLEFGGIFRTGVSDCDYDVEEGLESKSQFISLISKTVRKIEVTSSENEEGYNDILTLTFDDSSVFIFFDYRQYEFMYVYNKKEEERYYI